MLISKEQIIAGLPATTLREFFRYQLRLPNGAEFNAEFPAAYLKQPLTAVRKTMKELIRLGYVKESDDTRFSYQTTMKGFALAGAKIGNGVSHESADKALAGLLDRVATVNASKEYAFRVGRVLLFGSMLTDKERVGDVDLIIELKPRFEDVEKQQKFRDARIQQAIAGGKPLTRRTTRDIGEYYDWPRREVWLFLKSRSSILSLHKPDEMEALRLKGTEFREITVPGRKGRQGRLQTNRSPP